MILLIILAFLLDMRELSKGIVLKSLLGTDGSFGPEHSQRQITKFRQKAWVATYIYLTVGAQFNDSKNQSAWTLCISKPLYWRLTIQSGECNYITKANCVTEQIFYVTDLRPVSFCQVNGTFDTVYS